MSLQSSDKHWRSKGQMYALRCPFETDLCLVVGMGELPGPTSRRWGAQESVIAKPIGFLSTLPPHQRRRPQCPPPCPPPRTGYRSRHRRQPRPNATARSSESTPNSVATTKRGPTSSFLCGDLFRTPQPQHLFLIVAMILASLTRQPSVYGRRCLRR